MAMPHDVTRASRFWFKMATLILMLGTVTMSGQFLLVLIFDTRAEWTALLVFGVVTATMLANGGISVWQAFGSGKHQLSNPAWHTKRVPYVVLSITILLVLFSISWLTTTLHGIGLSLFDTLTSQKTVAARITVVGMPISIALSVGALLWIFWLHQKNSVRATDFSKALMSDAQLDAMTNPFGVMNR